MKVRIDKSFERDVKKIKDKALLGKIADTIEQVQTSGTIEEIRNIKKLKSSSDYYRIRLGDYRIGIFIDEEVVDFIRLLHRKDIYNQFP